MSRKLVEREHLKYLSEELFLIKLAAPSGLQKRLEDLIDYVEKNIVQSERDLLNETKRTIHEKRKNASTEEENKMWHDFYKEL